MANDVSSSLPQVDLLHGSVLTVTLDVAGAVITALNVHGMQEEPFAAIDTTPEPLLVPVAEEAA